MANIAAAEPTFDLPAGSASDFYLSREVNSSDDKNHGKVLKKHGLWKYPFLTRRTGDSLVGTNEEITSNELRHGRTASKTKLGNESSSGSHDFEFSPETFDDQLEGLFRSEWVRWTNDGESNLITKDYLTQKGYIHVNGDIGTYNQDDNGKRVTSAPLFYTDADTTYGLIKVSPEVYGYASRAAAGTNPLGKFVAHEIHIGEKPVKYSFMSRIPINGSTVRYQDFKHVEVGEMNLNVTVNAIVTGSFNLQGSNNPSYYTENLEKGKTRMAVKMEDDKDVAIYQDGSSIASDETYGTDYRAAAEKFIATLKETTKSTETDQFTALEGFLFVNGHQIQYASDLTMDVNNNLQPINAIFVRGAIANLAPKLDVTGNITVYFTDGEMDSTGMKYGADDLKNLASQNKDVELIYAFQDKEDPEVLYLFQIFKSTFSAPQETKDAESPISLDLSYTSYGEMAVRCLRLAVPKMRDIDVNIDSVLDGTNKKKVSVVITPNVPLDATSEADYVDEDSDLYVFKDAEVNVIKEGVTSDAGATFSNVAISNGVITSDVTVDEDLAVGDNLQIILTCNGETCEETVAIEPDLDYIVLKTGDKLVVDSDGLDLINDGVLLFGSDVSASDLEFKSDDTAKFSVSDLGVVSAVTKGADDKANITVTSKYDSAVTITLPVVYSADAVIEAPTISGVTDKDVTTGDTLTITATVSDAPTGATQEISWSKNGKKLYEKTTNVLEITDVAESDAGKYTITVINSKGGLTNSASASATVTVS